MPIQKKPMKPEVALSRLQALCARSEQCSHDLIEKLRRWGVPSSDAEKVMENLYKYRFCDDSRFAEAFARDKAVYNRWGRRKISAALYAKRIPQDLIAEALDALDQDEYMEALRSAARSKACRIDLSDYEIRVKLFRHLASRGYESDLISKVIKELQAEQAENSDD